MRTRIRIAGRRAGVVALALLLSLSVAAALAPAPAAPAAPRVLAAASGKGTVTLTLVTPRGVPATALLALNGSRAAAAKGTRGTKVVRRLTLKPGSWAIVAEPVLWKDRYYVPTARPERVRVTAGRSTSATVTWRPAPTAHDLTISDLADTTLRLSFAKPTKRAKVAIRYAPGQRPPSSVTKGHAAAVSGTTASATHLRPGTPYSFGLFTRVHHHWLGPLPLTATTRPAAGSTGTATYVVNPGSILVPAGSRVPVTPVGDGQIRAALPRGITPTIGTSLLLPTSPALPSGFVGRISAVSTDGRHVTLEQESLGAVFDYLKAEVPDLSTASAASPLRQSGGAAPGRAGEPCTTSGGMAIDVHPKISFGGDFSVELAMKKHFRVPTSAGVHTHMRLIGTFEASASISVTGTYECNLAIGESVLTFMAGPVPMMVRYKPELGVSVTGQAHVTDVGYAVTAGFDGTAYIPVAGFHGNPDIHVDPIGSARALEPHSSETDGISVTIDAKLGGTLSIGPGIGGVSSEAGAQAGIQGELFPVHNSVEVSYEQQRLCATASVQGDASLALFVAAWLPHATWDATYDWLSGSLPYGGPWRYCGQHTYQIVAGHISYDVSAPTSCTYPAGECTDYYGGYTESSMHTDQSVKADLTVNPANGPSVTSAGDPVAIGAPMNLDSLTHQYVYDRSFSHTPCAAPATSTFTDSAYDFTDVPLSPSIFNVSFGLTPGGSNGFSLALDSRAGTEPRFGWVYPVGLRWTDSSHYPVTTVTVTGTGPADCAPSYTWQTSAISRGMFDPAVNADRTETTGPTTYGQPVCQQGSCIVHVTGSTSWTYLPATDGTTISGGGTVTWWADIKLT